MWAGVRGVSPDVERRLLVGGEPIELLAARFDVDLPLLAHGQRTVRCRISSISGRARPLEIGEPRAGRRGSARPARVRVPTAILGSGLFLLRRIAGCSTDVVGAGTRLRVGHAGVHSCLLPLLLPVSSFQPQDGPWGRRRCMEAARDARAAATLNRRSTSAAMRSPSGDARLRPEGVPRIAVRNHGTAERRFGASPRAGVIAHKLVGWVARNARRTRRHGMGINLPWIANLRGGGAGPLTARSHKSRPLIPV